MKGLKSSFSFCLNKNNCFVKCHLHTFVQQEIKNENPPYFLLFNAKHAYNYVIRSLHQSIFFSDIVFVI